ncbi:MAG: zf-HC2 domain-containing protein [Acidobacteria bacterium]|nr:zf-HC2 domain-containing protein [Acidobacteriota bacterium]
MKCPQIEERLSEYLERTLPASEMEEVAAHVHGCGNCSALLEEMRSALLKCRSFPVYEPDIALIDRVLLRTTGKPRTRSFRELLDQYFLRTLLTPRFAMGAVVTVLFLTLSASLLLPRAASIATALSPREVFRTMDRGVQAIYSRGLKIYDKKNEWQAQLSFFKNNMFNRLGIMIEQLDVPQEGKKKSGEPRQQQEKNPGDKTSSLLLLPT